MKGVKALFVTLVILFIAFIAIGSYVGSERIVIEELVATIDIDQAGNITVEEDIIMNYKGDYNERWRDVRYDKNHQNNPLFYNVEKSLYINDNSYLMSAEIIKVEKDGVDITDRIKIGYSYNGDFDKFGDPVECDPYSSNCESLYFDATQAGGLEGDIVISYKYEIAGMVTQYNDISELNYRLFDYMEATVKKATVNVYLTPSTDEFEEGDFYCYGHGLASGKITQSVKTKTYVNQPDFSYTARNIKTDEFFELRILMPNDMFTMINSNNIVRCDMFNKIEKYELNLAQETNTKIRIANFVNIVTAIVVVAIILLIIYAYIKFDKEYKPEFDGEYYRDLPSSLTPAEMSYLYYFGKTNDEDVTATLLDLIRKKVLILDVKGEDINKKKPNYIVSINREVYGAVQLLPHEDYLVNWFIGTIGNGEKVSFDEIEDFTTRYTQAELFQRCADKFKKCIKNECKSHDFFEERISKSKGLLYAIGVAVIFIAVGLTAFTSLFGVDMNVNLIIMCVFAVAFLAYTFSIKKRSRLGNEEYVKWKAFKKFLTEFSDFEDYPIPSIIVWEKYLVYATSLKIADKVMDQLEVKLPEYDDSQTTYMRRNYYGYHFHYHAHFRVIDSSVRNARNNAYTTIAAHHAKSSGGGHGGGFSGGSSFGGGGGGGRSR